MASYFSSLINKGASLLSSEADGDTPDDTHICRVLRTYYTEKGRAFPSWLPPDPKSAPAPTQQINNTYAPVGAGYGGLAGAGGSSKLGSLWDSPASGQAQTQPASLRQGRGAGVGRNVNMQTARAGGGQAQGQYEDVQARPLPSQRAGSYQSTAAGAPGLPSNPAAGGGSAQDRLKQRLWGAARSGSPSNSITSSNSGGGGSSLGNMVGQMQREGSFGKQGERGAMPAGAGSAVGGSERPYVAAGNPWDTGSPSGYGAGGGSGGGGAYDGGGGAFDSGRAGGRAGGGGYVPPNQGRRGLPSGPRDNRR